jgi:hypothetical protein
MLHRSAAEQLHKSIDVAEGGTVKTFELHFEAYKRFSSFALDQISFVLYMKCRLLPEPAGVEVDVSLHSWFE